MKASPTILVYAHEPLFFERRDTWFNRRGVDVFCAMSSGDIAQIAAARRVDLLLSQGAPGGLSGPELRELLPAHIPVIVLAQEGDDTALLDSWRESPSSRVINPPYGESTVMKLAGQVLSVPTRHYLRILVQMAAQGQSLGFGFSNNVSATGMLLETRRKLAIGSELEVSFLLPSGDAMTRTAALVVREAPFAGSGHRFGVQFVGLSAANKASLRALRADSEVRHAAAG